MGPGGRPVPAAPGCGSPGSPGACGGTLRAVSRNATTSAAVVVPVKAFHQAKVRLASALDPHERADLARHMAEIVLLAADPLPAVVVCDDDDVRAWAERSGARVVWCPGRGLNGAVSDGVAAPVEEGVAHAIVAHADARHPARLAGRLPGRVPRTRPALRRHNVLALPTDSGFTFSYGAGSFGRHRAEAAAGLPACVVQDPHLGWDVDLPADLAYPGAPEPRRGRRRARPRGLPHRRARPPPVVTRRTPRS